jgi:hypothetical protein
MRTSIREQREADDTSGNTASPHQIAACDQPQEPTNETATDDAECVLIHARQDKDRAMDMLVRHDPSEEQLVAAIKDRLNLEGSY